MKYGAETEWPYGRTQLWSWSVPIRPSSGVIWEFLNVNWKPLENAWWVNTHIKSCWDRRLTWFEIRSRNQTNFIYEVLGNSIRWCGHHIYWIEHLQYAKFNYDKKLNNFWNLQNCGRGLEPSIKATIIFMFEKYNAHSRRHNDIVYLSLCRVQTDVSREQEIQFIILFFDLLL